MKRILTVLFAFGLFSCNRPEDNTTVLQNRIDSLENKLAKTYKPGMGEFMSDIQAHHLKLWFAGQNQNWKLADFEVSQITGTIEDIKNYQAQQKESKMMGMIRPALDSINNAIQQKNPVLFKSSYALLTNACNNCHRTTNVEFNVVITPETQPFSNQDFKTNK